MKRSKQIALVTMGLSSLALSACGETEVDAKIFRDVKQCIADGQLTQEQCENAQNIAIAEHYQVAPTYDSQDKCELESGPGNCEEAPYSGSKRNYMPMMVGYMLGANSRANPQPLYPTASGMGLRNAGNHLVGAKTGSVKVSKAAARAPVQKSVGGFGSTGSRMASSGG